MLLGGRWQHRAVAPALLEIIVLETVQRSSGKQVYTVLHAFLAAALRQQKQHHGCGGPDRYSHVPFSWCHRNNLGGFDGALSQAQVASGVIITAPAIYNSSGAGRRQRARYPAAPLAALQFWLLVWGLSSYERRARLRRRIWSTCAGCL